MINSWPVFSVQSQSRADPECVLGGAGGSPPPPPPTHTHTHGIHKFLYASLEILVQNPLEKQLDPHREAIGPEGPVAPRGRSVQPSVKYVEDNKIWI